MNNKYVKVDLLTEFKNLKNIDKINEIFEQNNWELVKTKNKYYQLYFGKNVQVDNMYEYGFPYLFDKRTTKKELERFINYRLELESILDEDNDKEDSKYEELER